jgi:hypothetical protein
MSQIEAYNYVENALKKAGFHAGSLVVRSYDERNFGNIILDYNNGITTFSIQRDRGQYLLDIFVDGAFKHIEDIYPSAKDLMETGQWNLEQILTIVSSN